MKVVIMEPLEDGDVFVVRRVGSFLFSTRIEVEKLRSEDEINEMIRYAHKNLEKPFWRGVKYALFWVTRVIEKNEVSVGNEDSKESKD